MSIGATQVLTESHFKEIIICNDSIRQEAFGLAAGGLQEAVGAVGNCEGDALGECSPQNFSLLLPCGNE